MVGLVGPSLMDPPPFLLALSQGHPLYEYLGQVAGVMGYWLEEEEQGVSRYFDVDWHIDDPTETPFVGHVLTALDSHFLIRDPWQAFQASGCSRDLPIMLGRRPGNLPWASLSWPDPCSQGNHLCVDSRDACFFSN